MKTFDRIPLVKILALPAMMMAVHWTAQVSMSRSGDDAPGAVRTIGKGCNAPENEEPQCDEEPASPSQSTSDDDYHLDLEQLGGEPGQEDAPDRRESGLEPRE